MEDIDKHWSVPSASEPGVEHLVRRWAGRTFDIWTCECKGYHYGCRQHANYACRHIKQVWTDLIREFERQLKGF